MPVSKSGADKSPPLFSFLKDPVLRARILKFGLVGFSGVFINNGILWLLVEFTSLPFYLCSFAAIETSILTNFFLNDNFTWKDRKTGNFFVRLLRYNSSTFFSSIFINMSVLMLFREWAGMQYIIANLIGIGCAMVSNFIMNSFWTYGEFRIDMPKSSRNIIAASLLLRLIIAAGIGAGFDEAYYYAYSLRPSLSYFDHPPAVGFLAGFFPFLTGSAGPFTIRLGTVLLYTLSSFIFYKLAAGMYGRKRAVFSLFLFSFTPMMLLGAGTMVLPDAPMVFFWILSLIFIRRIFFGEEKNINYLMAGLLTGLTFMSKYHGAFLGIFLFLFLLMRRPGKFLSAGPYIYFSASLLAALPVFIWNYRNGFISFLFQGERAGGTNLRPDLFLQAVGGQAGYLTPMVFIPLLFIIVKISMRALREKDHESEFIFYLGVLPVFFFNVVSFFRPILPHWTMAGYITLMLPAGKKMYEYWHLKIKFRNYVKLSTVAVAFLLAASFIHTRTGYFLPDFLVEQGIITEKDLKKDATLDVWGWQEAASFIRNNYPNGSDGHFVFTHKWFLSGELDLALEGEYTVTCFNPKDPRGYGIWAKEVSFLGREGVFVCTDRYFKDPVKKYRGYFKDISSPDSLIVKRGKRNAKTFYFYDCGSLQKEFDFPF